MRTEHAAARRVQPVWMMTCLVLFLAVGLLAACGSDSDGNGGGGGGDLNLGRRQMTVQVELPTGVTASAVQTVLGESPVANGTAQVPTFDGRQLTIAVAASGEPLLIGYLGDGNTTLDAERMAEALLFWASGAVLLPPEEGAQEAALAAIAGLPELADLAEAIEAALVANPGGFLEDGNYDDVVEELEEAVAALQAQAPDGRGVLVQPLESKSGITVNTTEGVNSIFLTNRYRRLGHAFIDRVSTFDEAGTETASPAKVTEIELPSIQKLSTTTSAFVDIIYGKNAFEEKSTAPVRLEAVADAAKTRYRLLVVGPGTADGDYGDLSQEEIDKQLEVTQVFVVKDLFLPMVLNMLIPASKLDDYLKFTGGGSLVKDVINILTSGAPKIWETASTGDIKQTLFLAWDTISRSGTFRNILLQRVLDAVMDAAGPDVADAAFANGKKLLNAMKVVDTLLAGIDGTAVGLGIGLSNKADIWQIDVTAPKVRLDPAESTLTAGSAVTLTANVPELSGSGENLVYKWANTAGYGKLTDGIVGHEDNFDSTRKSVVFTADSDSGAGTDTITVEVYRLAGPAGSDRELIGEATATVEVQGAVVTLSPTHADIEGGESVVINAEVEPEPNTGQLEYHWTSTTNAGDLQAPGGGRADFTTDSSNVRYEAEQDGKGTDTITVEVFHIVGSERHRYGSAQGTVTVDSTIQRTNSLMLFSGWTPGTEPSRPQWENYTLIAAFTWRPVEGKSVYTMKMVQPPGGTWNIPEERTVTPSRFGSGYHYRTAAELEESYAAVGITVDLDDDLLYFPYYHRPYNNYERSKADTSPYDQNYANLLQAQFEIIPVR